MVGGVSTEGLVHSTEIYRNSVWTNLPSATLPAGNFAFIKAAKVDDTIFFLGETVEKSLIAYGKYILRDQKWGPNIQVQC